MTDQYTFQIKISRPDHHIQIIRKPDDVLVQVIQGTGDASVAAANRWVREQTA